MPLPQDITLVATPATAYEIDLSWTDSVGTAVNYQIQRNGVTIATVPSTQTTYADTVLAPNSTYSYVVNGLNSVPTAIYDSNTETGTTDVATCDAYWNNVSLMLHCDGTNGSTLFPDASINNHTVSAAAVTVSTANPEFGTGAALMSASTGALTVGNSAGASLDLTTGDFTVEFGIYIGATAPSAYFGSGGTTYTTQAINAYNTASRNVQTELIEASGTVFPISPNSGPNNLNANAWNHVALCRFGSSFQLFVNGVGGLVITNSNALYDPGNSGSWAFGKTLFSSTYAGIQYDEIRITKGVARYVANFTPPGAAFPGSCLATVPNVVGQALATAESNIVAAGLVTGTVTTQFSLTVPGGDIISQSPVGGVGAMVGSSVNLVESSGPGSGTVPDVINLSIALAEAAIIAAGFTVGTVSNQPDLIIIPGNVDAQSPAGGATAYLLSPVDITLSRGADYVVVPDLELLTEAQAIALIESLGLVVGAVSSAPSATTASGLVMAQNPSAGNVVASGSIIAFVVSTGVPVSSGVFDFEATVISQYANSPTLLQLIANMNQYIDQTANFAQFLAYVWNVDTAVGFGLDIWGKIVGVSRLLEIPNTTDYVGFDNSATPPPDWQTMGSDQPPQPAVGGAMYTGYNATDAYLLPDNAYRQLILAKAFANICTTTAPAINQILQNLYGEGTAWVLNTGVMAVSYNLNFTPTAIQLAILEQSGVIPTPPGVSVVINTDV
jgi:beta-lactam-binding protein with PASTA domain